MTPFCIVEFPERSDPDAVCTEGGLRGSGAPAGRSGGAAWFSSICPPA